MRPLQQLDDKTFPVIQAMTDAASKIGAAQKQDTHTRDAGKVLGILSVIGSEKNVPVTSAGEMNDRKTDYIYFSPIRGRFIASLSFYALEASVCRWLLV